MKFYVLTSAEIGSPQDRAHRTDADFEDGFDTGDAPRCPACGDPTGMRTWLPPYRVELEVRGREYADLIFMTSELLVSLRFKQLWEESGLVGLSGFEPVEVIKAKRRRKLKGDPPPYFKADVARTQAVVDEVASGYEWEGTPDICPVCRLPKNKDVTFLRQKGTVIDPATWTGEDLFIPLACSDIIATERCKAFCEANDITNALFTPAEEYGHDFYPSLSTQFKKYLRILEKPEWHRGMRQDAYTTLLLMIDGNRDRFPQHDFDPDTEIDPQVIDEVRRRIAAEQ